MIYMLRKLVQVIKARKLSPNSDEYHNHIKKNMIDLTWWGCTWCPILMIASLTDVKTPTICYMNILEKAELGN